LTYYFDERPILSNVNASFPQGKMYAFVGPPHQGKSTLMKLMGQVLLPNEKTNGNIFVPPHLRLLHLSQETFLLSDTLLKNIVFKASMEKVGGLERVRDICKILRFPPGMMEHLKDEEEPESMAGKSTIFRSWMSTLSYTDLARVNLARAFIMNPECLILHKPSLAFDDSEAPLMVQLLRQHVDEKGLCLPERARGKRRRRTVFFTTASMDAVDLADVIYKVTEKDGAVPVSKAEAQLALGNLTQMNILRAEGVEPCLI